MLFYISYNCIFAINYSILLTAPSTQIVINIKNTMKSPIPWHCHVKSHRPIKCMTAHNLATRLRNVSNLSKKSTTNQTKQKNFFSTPKKFTIFLLIKFSFCDILFNETRQNIPNGSTILRVRLRDDNTTDPA